MRCELKVRKAYTYKKHKTPKMKIIIFLSLSFHTEIM